MSLAMPMHSGLRLDMQDRRGLKSGAGAMAAGERSGVARPALCRVPDPYSF
jgi:hypothetical protein